MKCPMCGNELRRSDDNPTKCLCDSCKVMFDWKEENKDSEYVDYSNYASTLKDYGVNDVPVHPIKEHAPRKKKKRKTGLIVVGMCFMFLLGFASGAFTIFAKLSGGVQNAMAIFQGNNEQSNQKAVDADDNIIDFTADDFHIKYVKHEFSKDYKGNKCLLYYYEYTNTSDKNATAGFSTNVQCFQDGSECETAIMADSNSSMDNYIGKEVQPGGTVEVCQAYILKSDSELTIEASALISFDDKKDTQKISVK